MQNNILPSCIGQEKRMDHKVASYVKPACLHQIFKAPACESLSAEINKLAHKAVTQKNLKVFKLRRILKAGKKFSYLCDGKKKLKSKKPI
jgi:hypothetical protein